MLVQELADFLGSDIGVVPDRNQQVTPEMGDVVSGAENRMGGSQGPVLNGILDISVDCLLDLPIFWSNDQYDILLTDSASGNAV